MVEKYSKSGRFLGCSKYPECKATRPIDGQPRAAAVETEHRCPKCGKPLLLRENKRGHWLACSGYPACKESFNLDAAGQPVPTVIETDYVCEKCSKPMVMRQGSRGNFLGCTGYPKCRNTLPVDDQGRPVTPVKVEVKCEKCGGAMGLKQGRRGAFLGCLNYPKCRSTAPVPEELKAQLGEQLSTPASGPAADLKAIVVEENLRELRRHHDRAQGAARLLSSVVPIIQVQGHPRARRGHPREDLRRGRKLSKGRAHGSAPTHNQS